MLFLDINDTDFDTRFAAILTRGEETSLQVTEVVRGTIKDIRASGDDALLEYTNRFDRLGLADASGLEITAVEIEAAVAAVPADDLKRRDGQVHPPDPEADVKGLGVAHLGTDLPVYEEPDDDDDGHSLIDFGSGIAVVHDGTANPRVAARVQEQVAQFTHTSPASSCVTVTLAGVHSRPTCRHAPNFFSMP